MPNHEQTRMQEKLRRILRIIDIMAQQRMPKSVEDIWHLVEGECCLRTIRRDVGLLVSMNIMVEAGKRIPRRSLALRGQTESELLYSINPVTTQNLQSVAIQIDEQAGKRKRRARA